MQHGTTTLPSIEFLSKRNTDQFTLKHQGKISQIRAGWDDCEMSDKAWNLLWKELEEEGILNRGKA